MTGTVGNKIIILQSVTRSENTYSGCSIVSGRTDAHQKRTKKIKTRSNICCASKTQISPDMCDSNIENFNRKCNIEFKRCADLERKIVNLENIICQAKEHLTLDEAAVFLETATFTAFW